MIVHDRTRLTGLLTNKKSWLEAVFALRLFLAKETGMLTFVLGRQGSGKSAYLYQAAARAAANGTQRQIFLVPETHSHEAERRLCEWGGDGISLACEVLTFRRLANRVFAEYG